MPVKMATLRLDLSQKIGATDATPLLQTEEPFSQNDFRRIGNNCSHRHTG